LPAHWSYTDAKAGLDAAGRLIDVTLAERRNLVMRNPAPIAEFETSRTLVAAYQMILPGEHAPSHRHSSHALRVIIDGKGAYSVVDGEKTPMETGDVVLTPGWCWHGHGHDGDRPAYWFDGLDVPLTHLLEPMFFEEHPQKYQKVERVAQTSPYRFKREDIIWTQQRPIQKASMVRASHLRPRPSRPWALSWSGSPRVPEPDVIARRQTSFSMWPKDRARVRSATNASLGAGAIRSLRQAGTQSTTAPYRTRNCLYSRMSRC
jgi:hypothetical protein